MDSNPDGTEIFRPLCVPRPGVGSPPRRCSSCSSCPLVSPWGHRVEPAALAQACERHKAGEGVGRWQAWSGQLAEAVGDTGFLERRLCSTPGSVCLVGLWAWGPMLGPGSLSSSVTDLNLQPHHQAWLAQNSSEVLKGAGGTWVSWAQVGPGVAKPG